MKRMLRPFTGIMLCAAPLHIAAADNTKAGEELHAVIDMSHADPRT